MHSSLIDSAVNRACEVWRLEQDFQQTNFRRSWRYLGNVTYYILAAQTIYYKYYFNKTSFCRSIEISGSLAPRQSINVLANLICPRHNNLCKTQWELQAMLTLRVRFARIQYQVKSKPFKLIAVSTRVRLSGSVEISNLTTALHLQRNQFQSERLSSI